MASKEIGYVQGVSHQDLVALGREHDLVVSLKVRPGSHTIAGTALAVLWPARQVAEDVVAGIRKAVVIGQARTPDQDAEFSVLLLEEMAVRALSPSTNDPYTALNALDDLSAGLVALAGRSTPSPYRYDEQGHLRVVAPMVVLTDLLDRVLDAMRLYAIEHPNVLHRTLELAAQVGAATSDQRVHARLDTHVQQLVEAFALTSPQDCDAQPLDRHAEQVRRSLPRSVLGGHL